MSHRRLAWAIIAGIVTAVVAREALRAPLGLAAAACCGLLAAGHLRRRADLCAAGYAAGLACVRLSWEGAVPALGGVDALAPLRAGMAAHIGTLLPEPHAAFLAGLLTGERGGLPGNVLEDMRRTGLTHILAVSGTNITLVIVALEHLLFFVPRAWRTAPLAAGVVAFTLFCGAEASVVRACIMGVLQLVALHVGRPAQSRLMIGWALAGMLLWDPAQLTDDAGFQLSFLAVLGLCEFQRPMERLFARVPNVLGLREALVTTLAAQLTAGPWAAYLFGTLPLHAPLLNLAVAPLIPVAMLTGAMGTATGLLHAALGRLCMAPAWLALTAILGVGQAGARAAPFILEGLQGSAALLALWLAGTAAFWRAVARKKPECAILPGDATARPSGATPAGGAHQTRPAAHP